MQVIKKTDYSSQVLMLLSVFFDANHIPVNVSTYHVVDKNHAYKIDTKIQLEYDDETDVEETFTFLALKHGGFENMLDDYFTKCGMSPHGRR